MLTDEEQVLAAQDELDYFSRKFREWYGNDHVILAYHAAFPVALSVDMLYQIWANFKTYADRFGRARTIPMLAVSDLLLSNLLRPTGRDAYEMFPDVRALLLNKLRSDERFGEQRIQELASFLFQYVQQLPDTSLKNFKENQRLAAFLAVDPLTAAQQTLQQLVDQVAQNRMVDSLGLTNLMETFAKENKDFTSLLEEHLRSADESTDVKKSDPAITKNLVLSTGGDGSITLNLAPHISNRLQGIQPVEVKQKPQPPVESATSKTFGLFIGISKYKLKSIRLPSSSRDAERLSECLKKYDLLGIINNNILNDKEASSENILSKLDKILSEAGPNDIVIIYFAGHIGQNDGSPFLATYDYDDKKGTIGITDSEFNRRITNHQTNDSHIIFVADGHGGSDKWLNVNNPKHICLFGSRPEQVAFESQDGGVFTKALIDAINRYQGAMDYRDLYRETYGNMLNQNAQINQLPSFNVSDAMLGNYVFTLKRPNEITLLQNQLSLCGYRTSPNDVEGADAGLKSQAFLSDHGISNEQKLRHYLSLKITVQQKNSIKVVLISSKTDPRIKEIFKDPIFEFSTHRIKVQSSKAKARAKEYAEFDKEEEQLDKKIFDADVVIMGYGSQNYDLYAERVGKVLDVTFWLNKELVLFSEDGGAVSHLNEEKYHSAVPWGNLGRTEDGPDIVYKDLARFREFLEKLLRINQRPQEQQAPYSKRIQEAFKSGHLDLANEGLQEIPSDVFNITGLEALYLEGNSISTIPPTISRLKSLKTLNLNGNPIKLLPPEILQLQQLQMLGLDNTDVEELPQEINKLSSLEELRLHGTPLVVLPYAVAQLKKLKVLDARETHILNVPLNILNHKNAPQRLRTFVKSHLSKAEIKKDALLILEDSKETNRLVRLLTQKRLRENTVAAIWMKPDLPTLYFVFHNIEHSGFIYVCDNEGKLFDEFKTMSPENRHHAFNQFFGTHSAQRIHLFYDGSPMGDEFGSELVKIHCISSFITCNSNTDHFPNDFTFSFFESLSTRSVLTGSFAEAEKKLDAKSDSGKIHYSLYKNEWFRDFFLSFTENMRNKDMVPLGELEEMIKNAKKTLVLDLRDRGLTAIPVEVFSVRKLESLNISANHISELPSTISKLTNLKVLDISRTRISSLPSGLFRLKNLRKLIMANSELSFIPPDIQQFKYLNTLDAHGTPIKVLPIELTNMPVLKYVDVSGNELINLPTNIAKNKSTQSFKKFFVTVEKKRREPVILQVSSSTGSFVDIAREHQRSSAPARTSYFQVLKNNVTSLLDAFKFVKDYINDRTVLMIDDQKGSLSSQFGNGEARFHNIRQFFSSFPYPLNVINHGFLDEASAILLETDGTFNSIINQGVGKSAISVSELLYDIMARAGLSYYHALDFIQEYFLSEKARASGIEPPFSFGFRISQSKTSAKDFYWSNITAIRSSPSLVEVIKKTKSLPSSVASVIVDRMMSERSSRQGKMSAAPHANTSNMPVRSTRKAPSRAKSQSTSTPKSSTKSKTTRKKAASSPKKKTTSASSIRKRAAPKKKAKKMRKKK